MTTCPDDGTLMGFLAEGDDPGGLRSHVEGCADCRRRLDGLRGLIGSLRMLAPAAAPPSAASRGSGPGHPAVLGKFFVIGAKRDREGEAVVVYRGLHRHVHQSGAILYLARTPLARDAAAREAITAACKPVARLDHPMIARAIDVGFWEDRPFLVVDDRPGIGLEDALKARTFSATEAAAIVAGLARAVASAHASGVVHGAISAASVVLDSRGNPALIDFGIAQLLGTAPKDANAEDRARDLSALGAILGRLAPSGRPSRSLDAVIARATATDPAQRFGDAGELSRALDRIARPWWSWRGRGRP